MFYKPMTTETIYHECGEKLTYITHQHKYRCGFCIEEYSPEFLRMCENTGHVERKNYNDFIKNLRSRWYFRHKNWRFVC